MISVSYWRHWKGITVSWQHTSIVLTFKTKVQKGATQTMTWTQPENLRGKVNSTETAKTSTEDIQDFPVMINGRKLLRVYLQELSFYYPRFFKKLNKLFLLPQV